MSFEPRASTVKVPPSGPTNARIMFVGEAPGKEEVQAANPAPLIGPSGREFSLMLNEVGITRRDCFLTNVARFRPHGNEIEHFWDKCTPKNRIPGQYITEGMNELYAEIEQVKPNVIVPLGNTALWALTGEWGITKWRNSELYTKYPGMGRPRKLVPTIHPAAVLRTWEYRHIVVNDLRKIQRAGATAEPWRYPERNHIIRPTAEHVLDWLNDLHTRLAAGPVRISSDLETIRRGISCHGLAYKISESLTIPFMGPPHGESFYTPAEEAAIHAAQRRVLTHRNAQVVGQNYLYDLQYILTEWLFVPNVWMDTMLAWHTVAAGEPKGLDFLSSLLCASHIYWKDELKDYNTFPDDEEQYWTYNGKDAVITLECANVLEQAVSTANQQDQYDFQMTMFWHGLTTMVRGARQDLEKRQKQLMLMWDEVAKIEDWFHTILPGYTAAKTKNAAPWFTSTQQLKKLFYEDLALPVQRDRKNQNRPTTNDEALEQLKREAPELKMLFQRIQEHRSAGVFMKNFLMKKLDVDDRMRCSYNIGGTETFRLSSSESVYGTGTNLQNVPKGNTLCPVCNSDETKKSRGEYTCKECAHKWREAA